MAAHAESLVREHFANINSGDLVAAKSQLFRPLGTAEKPLDVYVQTMAKLAPFEVVSVSVGDFEDVRPKRHGSVATMLLHVVVNCSAGQRATAMSVWWFPEQDRYLISSRPTELVLERLKADDGGTG